ncbi:cytochrome C oxidase subunit IV family protein [Desmospora profundinema]|uniref:Cytochrome c oxidase subunit 4 n=1 Tax=Desmospora profundinema TaxID=1571184 RepID=A0ABU1IM37_9BACL|nr:cytochrome C oxidase subunit IV family protein [Desmospora profundinema]MDR6225844.1 cytochrome c oxidase subunit 4 [Desmospora profundinema]
METKVQTNQQQTSKPPASEGAAKHVKSFALMILLTAAAFALVVYEVMPPVLLIPVIVGLAMVQVFLQLFTFMHLDMKKHKITVAFMMTGLFIGILCAVALWLLEGDFL